MRDFLTFSYFFGKTFWICRGILFILLAFVFFCAFLISHFEKISYFEGLYMSMITALTIGYGDVIPYTVIGKVLSIIVGFTGLVFVGLAVAIATEALRETANPK